MHATNTKLPNTRTCAHARCAGGSLGTAVVVSAVLACAAAAVTDADAAQVGFDNNAPVAVQDGIRVPVNAPDVLYEDVRAGQAAQKLLREMVTASPDLRAAHERTLLDLLASKDFRERNAVAAEFGRSTLSSAYIAGLAEREGVHPAARELLRDAAFTRFGNEPRAAIGIRLEVARFGVGSVISRVEPGAPAGEKGLLFAGDRIVRIAGRPITDNLRPLVFSYAPGDTVEMVVVRPVPPDGVDPANPENDWWNAPQIEREHVTVDVELGSLALISANNIVAAGELRAAWEHASERAGIGPAAEAIALDPLSEDARDIPRVRQAVGGDLVVASRTDAAAEQLLGQRDPRGSLFDPGRLTERQTGNAVGVVTLTHRVAHGDERIERSGPRPTRDAALELANLADRAAGRTGNEAEAAGRDLAGAHEDVSEQQLAELRDALLLARRAFWHAVLGSREHTTTGAAQPVPPVDRRDAGRRNFMLRQAP
jgi:hypothetical protein